MYPNLKKCDRVLKQVVVSDEFNLFDIRKALDNKEFYFCSSKWK